MGKTKIKQNTIGISNDSNESYKKMYLHMQQTPLAAIEWNQNFEITDWNKSAEKMFGFKRNEIIGKHAAGTIFPKNLKDIINKAGSEFLSSSKSTKSVVENLTSKGGVRTCEWYSTPLVDNKGLIVGAASLVIDITEKKQAEERLRQLAAIVESTDVAIVGLNLEGKVQNWNRGAKNLYGYTFDEMKHQSIVTIIPPSHQQKMLDIIAEIKSGSDHIEPFETQRIAKNGNILDIFMTITPTKDLEGKVIGLSNIGRDITERKEYERDLHILNKQLERSNRELQDFASVASHDLQEPLRKIQAFGDRLKTKYAPELPVEAADYVERMQNAAGRMQTLINDLLTFARVTTKAQPFKKVNLNTITKEVLTDLEVRIADYKAKIVVNKLPVIEADPIQMRQLLQNIIGNGLKFHKEGVSPTLKIYCDRSKNEIKALNVVIEDNGIGFDEKYLDRIFNVFQRLHTQSEYKGTGVGLAVCRKIVERHNGSITAKSGIGKGAKFIISLPTKQGNNEMLT